MALKKFSDFKESKKNPSNLAPTEVDLNVKSNETPVETNIVGDFEKNVVSNIMKQTQSGLQNFEKQKARVPKMEQTIKDKTLYPGDHSGDWDGKPVPMSFKSELAPQEVQMTEKETQEMNENYNSSSKKIVKTGKLAVFPQNTDASKAVSYLENIKIPKKDIWYVLVEKQDNELQMVKYNYKVGVHLNKFVSDLKDYYINKYKDNLIIKEAFEKITVEGTDKLASVKNISSNIKIGDRRLITLFTEDLVKLLAK